MYAGKNKLSFIKKATVVFISPPGSYFYLGLPDWKFL